MKKTFVFFALFISILFQISAESNKVKFLKGNISDKTKAVKESSGKEGEWLSNEAIKFALDNKDLLQNDKDLDALIIAAIFSISSNTVKNYSSDQIKNLSANLIQLFKEFPYSNTVKVALISKFLSLKEYLPINDFTKVLNDYLSNTNINQADSGVIKASINALAETGDNESFIILYTFSNNSEYNAYKTDIENAMASLMQISINEILTIINNGNFNQIEGIFNLTVKNSHISKNNLCEIAENVLTKAILLVEESSKTEKKVIELQTAALNVLNENNWTRASNIAVNYFKHAKKLYEANQLDEKDFILIIKALNNIAPIDSISPLISYLEDLNSKMESKTEVSSEVVLSVIQTLGAIGDKSAFDSLLAVTYINYPESVLSAAREALAGLRW